MDAPRCLVCNTKHWSRQACPAMGGIVDQRALKQARLEVARETLRQAETVTKTTPAVKTESQPIKIEQVKTSSPVKTEVKTETTPVRTAVKTGFDKKAWMKTYMRTYM